MLINFNDFSILEYKFPWQSKFDIQKFVKTISSEKNKDILNSILTLLNTRLQDQEEIEDYYNDDNNMLLLPVEIVKQKDLEAIEYVSKMIRMRLSQIKDEERLAVGYKRKGEKSIDLGKQDLSTAYHRIGLGYKKEESFIYKFEKFIQLDEAKKVTKKDVGKEIRKELNRKERKRRLESGADLTTKVVPDKKKEYNRQKEKKVDLDED